MSMKDGGPAFPGGWQQIQRSGMSLRDWFAGQAINLFHFDAEDIKRVQAGERPAHEVVARICYDFADAMLAERERREGGDE